MFHSISALIALYVFWLLLSGHYTAFFLAAGAGSAIAAVLFSRRMDVIDREGHPIHLIWRALYSYWPWLAKEITSPRESRADSRSPASHRPHSGPVQADQG